MDKNTMIGLLRAAMMAHYADMRETNLAVQSGGEIPGDNALSELQSTLVSLCTQAAHAMDTGEITPFSGKYTEWLTEKGYLNEEN